jgi:hypothetical protein
MKKNRRTLFAAAAIATLAALSGCWDDNNNNNDPVVVPPVASTEVPDSAGVSVAAFVSFILSLSASDESSEPLTIKATFAVPADEIGEPTLL